MKTFRCECGAKAFFENVQCLSCSRELAYAPPARAVTTVMEQPAGTLRSLGDGADYRRCDNQVQHNACNWLIPADEDAALCRACGLNRTIPDLSKPEDRSLWLQMEAAKRRLVYTLDHLQLPLVSRHESPDGLAFDILSGAPEQPVLTGHADGVVTINLAEADPVWREQTRLSLGEAYRTLLGHFRHEVGHYYWDRLVRDSKKLAPFRELFGDERADYQQALQTHYESPRTDWSGEFISAYASAHPFEDWAETWAHYLHLVDTVETAHEVGFARRQRGAWPPRDPDVMVAQWRELTVGLNALNRSMGMPDPYPFEVAPRVRDKLAFVHAIIRRTIGSGRC